MMRIAEHDHYYLNVAGLSLITVIIAGRLFDASEGRLSNGGGLSIGE
jgi:hypothetical protein